MNHPDWLLPLVWLVTATIMIWQSRSRTSLILAGIMVGVAIAILTDAYLPALIRHIDFAYQWFNFIGLGWFMFFVGGLALGMIWVFDRW